MRIYLARPLLADLRRSATTEPRAAERVEPGPPDPMPPLLATPPDLGAKRRPRIDRAGVDWPRHLHSTSGRARGQQLRVGGFIVVGICIPPVQPRPRRAARRAGIDRERDSGRHVRRLHERHFRIRLLICPRRACRDQRNQRHRPYVAHDGLLIIRGAHGKAGVNATSHNAGRLWVPAGIDVEAAVVHFDFRHLRRVRRRERTRRELKQIGRYFAEPAVSGMFAALHLGQRRRTSHLRI